MPHGLTSGKFESISLWTSSHFRIIIYYTISLEVINFRHAILSNSLEIPQDFVIIRFHIKSQVTTQGLR